MPDDFQLSAAPAPVDVYRWRHGDTDPVDALVPPGVPVAIGDLVWLDDAGVCLPATWLPPGTSPEADRERFCERFLGVAMNRAREGCPTVKVATAGVHEFACAPRPWRLGEPVQVAVIQGRLALGTVEPAASARTAIGRVDRFDRCLATKCQVRIYSRIFAVPIS